MVQAAPRLVLRLDVISRQVSGVWYFIDATQKSEHRAPFATRHRRDMTQKLLTASDQGLQCVFIGISIKDFKKMNYYTRRPLKWKWTEDGRGFDPRVRQHSLVEISHGIISTAIISLTPIQVGQLPITGEKMCT